MEIDRRYEALEDKVRSLSVMHIMPLSFCTARQYESRDSGEYPIEGDLCRAAGSAAARHHAFC